MRVTLSNFINPKQLWVIRELERGEEGAYFSALMGKMADHISKMPVTYATEGQGNSALAQLHYFIGDCDWWIIEKDCEEEQLQAYGYACLGDPAYAEYGYISIPELLGAGAELDLHWEPIPMGEVKVAMGIKW